MDYQKIVFEKKDRIAHITLNCPEKLNALSLQLLDEFFAAVAEVDLDDGVSVLVIKGAGRAFCAGYDISPNVASWAGTPSAGSDRARLRRSLSRWYRLWNLRQPTIAQVQGHCLAGGGELIGMCDIVIAAENAQFGHPAGRALGIPITLGIWPLLVGMRRSKQLLFTGDTIDGKTAERWGMVNMAVPADRLEEEVNQLAERIAKVPLDALTVHKHATNRYFEVMGVRTAMESGVDLDVIYHASEVFQEFQRISQEKGLKAALEWRDKPFAVQEGK